LETRLEAVHGAYSVSGFKQALRLLIVGLDGLKPICSRSLRDAGGVRALRLGLSPVG
jgi:hypothetical protein